MKRASFSCCNFLCVVLAVAYLKYRRCRLSCLPFVWHFFSLWHTHTHVPCQMDSLSATVWSPGGLCLGWTAPRKSSPWQASKRQQDGNSAGQPTCHPWLLHQSSWLRSDPECKEDRRSTNNLKQSHISDRQHVHVVIRKMFFFFLLQAIVIQTKSYCLVVFHEESENYLEDVELPVLDQEKWHWTCLRQTGDLLQTSEDLKMAKQSTAQISAAIDHLCYEIMRHMSEHRSRPYTNRNVSEQSDVLV